MNNTTTITAPSTALINQPISIIRISGKDTYKIINNIFSVKIEKPDKNKIVYGFIKDKGTVIDEVLLLCFKKPFSFTGEDMIEINCHGGVFITKKILNLLVLNGATLAKKGEFSQRAFANGKINLIQADSIHNLIFSQNDVSAQISINNILGKNFDPIIRIRKKILDIIANVEVNIDYPEYDGVGDLTLLEMEKIIFDLIIKMQKIIRLSKIGKLINDGIKTAIIGKPNVGKSSFLNSLLNEEKAIVSEIEGTTRDLVEGNINIKGITLNLIDTAGIRDTDNKIEKLGINKSKELINKADLILLLLDSSQTLNQEDEELLKLTANSNRIVIINKIDIKNENFDPKSILKDIDTLTISAKKRKINNFLDNIESKYSEIELLDKNNLILLNMNHISILNKILSLLKKIKSKIQLETPVDILSIDLSEIWKLLGNLLGEEYQENILDAMFRNYCLGK